MVLMITNSCKEDPLPTKGNIAGRITEEGSNTPIAAATIIITDAQQSYKTGEDGSYKISDLFASDYSVTVSKQGYLTDTKILTVVPEKTTPGDFSLKKDIPTANPNSVILTYEKKSESIELANTRSGEMQFTTETSKTWLSVSPATGTIASQNKRIIIITADLTNVPFGSYDERLIINVGEASLSIPIQVTFDQPPYINIEKPAVDESYKMGETMPILWNSNLTGKVRIDLIKFSSVYLQIKKEVQNNEGGNYSWQIPALDATSYQLKITSIENENISSTSGAFAMIIGPTAPTVITKNPEELTPNTIKIGGSITNIGLQATQVDQYGHVYSKINSNPTIADNKTNLGTSSEPKDFVSTITDLEEAQTFYVAAYATNTKGTAYGEVLTVTTPSNTPTIETAAIVSITQTGAISGGTLISDGGNSIIERGICYSSTSPVDIFANIIKDNSTELGAFTSTLTDLQVGTTYFVRSYAKNSSGVGYGEEKNFKTLSGIPTVLSLTADALSGTTANASGRILANGGEILSSYGFCYSTHTNPTIGDFKLEVGNTIEGDFSGILEGLIPSTKYYVRAYATNSAGTGYGAELYLTTAVGNYLTFISPYKDEVYVVGETHTIEWTSNYSNRRIIIEHWNNGSFTELTNNVYSGNNSYSWYLPENTEISTKNTIKIIDYATLELLAFSQEFTIPGKMSIIKPMEGSLVSLDSLPIEWMINYPTKLTIELYQGSQFVTTILSDINSMQLKYTWNGESNGITDGVGYRIKIIDESNTDLFKLSGSFEFVNGNSLFLDSRDNQMYKIVTIGNQTWFAQDLNYKTTNSIANSAGMAYTSYGEASYACPIGWSIPSVNDWSILESYVGSYAGTKLKSSTEWNGTDEVGFNAIPSTGGMNWWYTTSEYGNAGLSYYYRSVTTSSEILIFNWAQVSNYGFNLRCIKD
jgi:uncharacterized protein (TIGR02145 family)